MKHRRFVVVTVVLAVVTFFVLAGAKPAKAGSFGLYIGSGGVGISVGDGYVPRYYAPAPVVVAPPPRYYTPAPVVVVPPPRYYTPAPRYLPPPPPPRRLPPPPRGGGWGPPPSGPIGPPPRGPMGPPPRF